MKVIPVVSLILALLCLVGVAFSLSCGPCNKKEICNSDGECFETEENECPPVPKDCRHLVWSPCGCCKVCAAKLGERCGRFVKACETHLKCVDGGLPNPVFGTCKRQ